MVEKPFDRRTAKAQGAALYATGKPCVKGHVAPRRTSNGTCIECQRLANQKHDGLPSRKTRRLETLKVRRQDSKWKTRRNAQERRNPRVQAAKLAGNLRRLYGLSLAEYDRLGDSQHWGCALCGGSNVSGRRLSVDHDHHSGAVRQLLCSLCNTGLGQFRDRPDLLRAAAAYVESFR